MSPRTKGSVVTKKAKRRPTAAEKRLTRPDPLGKAQKAFNKKLASRIAVRDLAKEKQRKKRAVARIAKSHRG